MKKPNKQLFWWIGALVLGTVLGLLKVGWIDSVCSFIATVYTRLFQFLALPTVALAIMTTLILFGKQRSTRQIFRHTITYTLLTTLVAALVGLGMYLLISPKNIPPEILGTATAAYPDPYNPGYVFIGTEDAMICYGKLGSEFEISWVKDSAPLAYTENFEYINGRLWLCNRSW